MTYGDRYRATVTDNDDPRQENRLLVLVPEVYGEATAWAMPSLPSASDVVLPGVGDLVWVSFERGDADLPVWDCGEAPAGEAPRGGYVGKYRGTVVDNLDPEGRARLRVRVPEVSDDEAWAARAVPGGDDAADLPAPGDDVWVEYLEGDVQHPTWVGVF